MAITVDQLTPHAAPLKPFPKLMKHIGTDLIVFFNQRECGMVLRKSRQSNSQGHFSVEWEMDCFEDFNGSLEISNS